MKTMKELYSHLGSIAQTGIIVLALAAHLRLRILEVGLFITLAVLIRAFAVLESEYKLAANEKHSKTVRATNGL